MGDRLLIRNFDDFFGNSQFHDKFDVVRGRLSQNLFSVSGFVFCRVTLNKLVDIFFENASRNWIQFYFLSYLVYFLLLKLTAI